jgi:TonB family protein
MESFVLYLFRSAVWLAGFTLVFILFLRDERFFFLKRIYLLSGIVTSLLLPLITVRYYIDFPQEAGTVTGSASLSETMAIPAGGGINKLLILFALYVSGSLFIVLRSIIQGRVILRSIRKSEITSSSPVKLIRTTSFTSSFSFFSYVFVNPSVSDVETREIVNHEMVHIRQRHWADLIFAELLCIFQWFNPLTWLYVHFIRQNHEYLADEGALQRTSDPSVYRATLLNQIAGFQIFSLSNPFSYSLTKRRFNMMKNINSSPYRKLKVLFIIPVMAAILVAFAKPEYRYDKTAMLSDQPGSYLQQQEKMVKGTVIQQNGTPLGGAIILLKGTTTGTVADPKGSFSIKTPAEEATLVITYVGYVSKVVKPDYNTVMKIMMVRDTIQAGDALAEVPPPPPPPPPILNDNGIPPYVVIDGKESKVDLKDIEPNSIESVSVLKDEAAIKKYGDKGKNGVLEITMKKPGARTATAAATETIAVKEDTYVMVEELPSFPGGEKAMREWIASNLKYPAEAVKKQITGQVNVIFEVTETGAIKNVNVEKAGNPLLDAEAKRVVSSMPAWKPGSQSGKPVNVYMKVLVTFELN